MSTAVSRIEFERILLPVEFSELSQPAELAALSLAHELRASVHALHVIEPLGGLENDPEVERFYKKLEKRAAESLAALAQTFERQGTPFTSEVAIGHRWSVIVDRAGELPADLLIMGTRGLEDTAPLAGLGSTSHRVAFHAPCPVMLVGRHSLDRQADCEVGPEAPVRSQKQAS